MRACVYMCVCVCAELRVTACKWLRRKIARKCRAASEVAEGAETTRAEVGVLDKWEGAGMTFVARDGGGRIATVAIEDKR